jgi:hypothetical protein
MKITVSKDGRYVVEGEMQVAEQHIEIDEAGQSIEWREGKSFDDRADVLEGSATDTFFALR